MSQKTRSSCKTMKAKKLMNKKLYGPVPGFIYKSIIHIITQTFTFASHILVLELLLSGKGINKINLWDWLGILCPYDPL